MGSEALMLHTMDTLIQTGRTTRVGECLVWHGAKAGRGYGVVGDDRERYVHRLVMLLDGRTVPPGHQAAHKCGNKACIEPTHLYAATQRQNERDKIGHGTYVHGSPGVSYCGKWLTRERSGPRCRREPHEGPCDPVTFEKRWQPAETVVSS